MKIQMLFLTFAVAISAIQMELLPAHRLGRNATALSVFSQISESVDFGAGGDIIKTIIAQFNEMITEITNEKSAEDKKGLGQCTGDVDGIVAVEADGSVTGCAAGSTCQTDQTAYQKTVTDEGKKIEGLNAEIETLAGEITDGEKGIEDAETALKGEKTKQEQTEKDYQADVNKHTAQLAILEKVQNALHENGTITMPESLLSVDEKKIIGDSRVTRPILLMVQVLYSAKPAEVVAIKKLLAEIISRIEANQKEKGTKHENDKAKATTKAAADAAAIADLTSKKNAAIMKKAAKKKALTAPTKAKADAENNIRTAGQLCVTGFNAFKTLQSGYDDEVAAIKEIITMLGGLTFNTDTKEKINSIETCLEANGGCAGTCTMVGNDVQCSCKSPKILGKDKKSCAEKPVWGPKTITKSTWASKPMAGGTLCLSIAEDIPDLQNTAVILVACDGSDKQLWSFLKNGHITNEALPGKCLDVEAQFAYVRGDCTDTPNQKWTVNSSVSDMVETSTICISGTTCAAGYGSCLEGGEMTAAGGGVLRLFSAPTCATNNVDFDPLLAA